MTFRDSHASPPDVAWSRYRDFLIHDLCLFGVDVSHIARSINMAPDIRSFFRGNMQSSTPAAKPPAKEAAKKRGRGRKIIEDDDEDDEVPLKKSTPKKAAAKKEPEPVLEDVSKDDYFGKGKPKRSEIVTKPAKKPAATNGTHATPKKGGKVANGDAGSARSSARKTKNTSYAELDENDFPDDDFEDAEDNFQADSKRGRRMGDDYKEASDEDDEKPLVPSKKRGSKKVKDEDDYDDDDFTPAADVEMKDGDDEDDFVVPDEDEEQPAKKIDSRESRQEA